MAENQIKLNSRRKVQNLTKFNYFSSMFVNYKLKYISTLCLKISNPAINITLSTKQILQMKSRAM